MAAHLAVSNGVRVDCLIPAGVRAIFVVLSKKAGVGVGRGHHEFIMFGEGGDTDVRAQQYVHCVNFSLCRLVFFHMCSRG